MHLPIVMSNNYQSDIIDVHGYVTFAVYVHYFLPGSLKIRTRLHTVRVGELGGLIDRQLGIETLPYITRRSEGERWLPTGEMPYPGYCRAPGSAKCLDVFCNCHELDRQWNAFIEKQKKKGRFTKIKTSE